MRVYAASSMGIGDAHLTMSGYVSTDIATVDVESRVLAVGGIDLRTLVGCLVGRGASQRLWGGRNVLRMDTF